MTVHHDDVSGSGDASAVVVPRGKRRILLLSLELNYSPFSGNGVLARSLAAGLAGAGCSVRAVCARPPAPGPGDSRGGDDVRVAIDDGGRSLEVWPVELSAGSPWKRLDRSGPWREYAAGCGGSGGGGSDDDSAPPLLDIPGRVASFRPTDVVAVDWHGTLAWESIRRGLRARPQDAPWRPESATVCYYNFRVYSSSSWGHSDDDRFYRERERASCRAADVVVCLAEHDRGALRRLMRGNDENDDDGGVDDRPRGGPVDDEKIKNVRILHPPLRGDVRTLAHSVDDPERLDRHLPPEARRALLSLPPSRTRGDRRSFVTCVARLSPEKSPHAFAALLRRLGGAEFLRRRALIPLLCGARSVEEYATRVVDDLRSTCAPPDSDGAWPCVVIERHLGPEELAAIYSRTVVNVHPSFYDAYGMTAVESAAFGVPSILNGGGKVGAASLLGEGEGCVAVDLERMVEGGADGDAEARAIASVIGGSTPAAGALERIGKEARVRALGWDEAACCRGLLDALGSFPTG